VGSCCRDENGQVIVSNEGSWWFPSEHGEGTCSSQLGVEGEMCDYNCGCQDGTLFLS